MCWGYMPILTICKLGGTAQVRDVLGVAAPTAVLFQMGSQGWKLAEKNPNEAGVFKGIFAAGDEGQQLIRVRAGKCQTAYQPK